MKKYLFLSLLALVAFTATAHAQTIPALPGFVSTTSPTTAITQRTINIPIKITGLTTGLCLTLDSNRILTTTACGGGGAGSGTISTSTAAVLGNLLYFSGPSTVANVATTTLVAGTNVSFSGGTPIVIGSSPITINATGGGSSFAYPFPGNATSTLLTFSGGIITAGLTNSSLGAGTVNSTAGGVQYVTATSTPTVTAPIIYSGTLGQFIGGSSGTFDCTSATGSVKGCLTAADWTTFNNKLSTAITAIGPAGQTQTGATQTLATSTLTLNGQTHGITIVGSGNTQTFTPTLTGTLSVAGGGTGVGTLTGLAKGNGTSAFTAAANGTDYTLITANTCGAGNHVSAITAAGVITCSADSGGGASSDFTYTTNFGITAAATSSNAIWGQKSIFASSTSATVPALSASNTTGPSFTTGTGNVGIGTSSPMALLSVAGNQANYGAYAHFGLSSPLSQCNTALGASSCLELVGNDNTTGGVGIYEANTNSGTSAYGGYVLTNNLTANATTNYSGIFLNSSNYSDTSFGTSEAVPNLLQLGNSMGPVSIQSFGPTAAGSYINFYAASTTPGAGLNLSSEAMRIIAGGNVGIGTTTPNNLLTVTTQTNTANGFAVTNSIGSSTVRAGTIDAVADTFAVATSSGQVEFGVDNAGHNWTGGLAPVLSTCGAGSPAITGDDNSGTITVGTGLTTACTMTFNKTWAQTPTCSATVDTTGISGFVNAISVTAVTFGIANADTGGKIYYQCTYHHT